MSEEQLSVDLIAAEIGVSRSGFYKRIKALTNHNPQEIIKEVKMKKAAEFLQDGRFNVGEVSMMCGFPNVKYFSTVFKKYFGMTPTQYIKENDLTNESLKERT